jgi:hypothetical protein
MWILLKKTHGIYISKMIYFHKIGQKINFEKLQFWKLSKPALHLVPGTTLDDAGPTFD